MCAPFFLRKTAQIRSPDKNTESYEDETHQQVHQPVIQLEVERIPGIIDRRGVGWNFQRSRHLGIQTTD